MEHSEQTIDTALMYTINITIHLNAKYLKLKFVTRNMAGYLKVDFIDRQHCFYRGGF